MKTCKTHYLITEMDFCNGDAICLLGIVKKREGRLALVDVGWAQLREDVYRRFLRAERNGLATGY